MWTLRTKLLKWTGPSHGPVPWKFVEKLLLNKGSISGLILCGKAWALNLGNCLYKAFLSSLGSRMSSGKVCCNCDPWEQTYQSELDPLMTQCLGNWGFKKRSDSFWKGLGFELGQLLVQGFSFFSWLQDQLWKSLLQLWSLRTNLSKWTGPSHGPVPWKFVEKLLFNEGSKSGLILFGKAWALNLTIAL